LTMLMNKKTRVMEGANLTRDMVYINLLMRNSKGLSLSLLLTFCSYCRTNNIAAVPFLLSEYTRCSSRKRKLARLIPVRH
jgi:hypothetical protein